MAVRSEPAADGNDPRGLKYTAAGHATSSWVGWIAFAGVIILSRVGAWYKQHLNERRAAKAAEEHHHPVAAAQVPFLLAILLCLMFSKFFYLASMTNYYTFYLIQKFGVSVTQSQIYLFVFLFAVAVGTIAGGPVGDSPCKFSGVYEARWQ